MLLLSCLMFSAPAFAADMVSDLPSGQPAGSTIRWIFTVNDPLTERFRLIVVPYYDPSKARMVYDFSKGPVKAWTPIDNDLYLVIGEMQDSAGNVSRVVKPFVIGPRTPETVDRAEVTPTSHPLVAFYSAPECELDQEMRVQYSRVGSIRVFNTHAKPCRPGQTMSFYVGGMRAESEYELIHEVYDDRGNLVKTGNTLTFTTGTPDVELPEARVDVPYDSRSSLAEPVLLSGILPPLSAAGSLDNFPHAVDIDGETIWYITQPDSGDQMVRPGGEGTVYTVSNSRLVQWDMVGSIYRMTTVERINQQLTDLGLDVINNFHHEARPLPGGRLAVLATVERLIPGAQPGVIDILGDMVLVLDRNLQVVWAWNAFDHLDVTREATIPKLCYPGVTPGCPPVLLIEEGEAADWMHSNTITYSPADGNLLISVRHQDWIIKIAYENGAGNGDVVWKLGPEGDFDLIPDNPSLWLTHPHDPNFINPNLLAIYDNGNLRCEFEGPGCESRGQAYYLNETAGVAIVGSIELGEYARAVGSAQPLANGNLFFQSGFPNGTPPDGQQRSKLREYLDDGTLIFEMELGAAAYRTHRMPDLYTLPSIWFD